MAALRIIDTLVREARYGLRMLRKSPSFAATVILTLGVAIGANTAVFSIVDTVLLRPLPYPEPDRLALVSLKVTSEEGVSDYTSQNGRTWETFRDHLTTADAAVFSSWVTGVSLATGRMAIRVDQQRVGARFFEILGTPPLIGREFAPAEDVHGGPSLVILSYALWQSAFDGARDVFDRPVLLRGEPHTVIGVMPEGFHSGRDADVWTPLRPSTRGEGVGENYQIVARVKADSSWEAASGEAESIGSSLVRDMRSRAGTTGRFSLLPLQRGLTESQRTPLVLLWCGVGLVLIVACVNIAGLLIARGARREQEILTRLALGSGRLGVVRQLLIENALLAAAGAVVGILIGYAVAGSFQDLVQAALGIWQPVSLSVRVLAVMVALSLAASVAFGVVPAFQASRLELNAHLSRRSGRVAGIASRGPRYLLVATQVAMGVVLLVGAALLVRSFLHLRGLQPGFDPRSLVTADISLQDARYRDPARVNDLFERGLARIRQIPGIEGAAVSLGQPYERILNMGFRLAGAERGTITNMAYVTPGYFETLRIPLRRGRSFRDTDTAGAPLVVVVNETFVRTHLADVEPIGRRLYTINGERQIVGIVGDVQQRPGFNDASPLAPTPVVYVPAAQTNAGFINIVHTWFNPVWSVRTSMPVDAVSAALTKAMAEVDPQLPFAGFRSMEEVRADALSLQRFLMTVVGVLAAAAVFLAVLGLHGLVAGSVVERTRELGIRMALGSSTARALRTVVLPGMVVALLGILAGGMLAIAATRVLSAFVWGISATDPTTFAGVALLLLAVVAVASVVPALRVLRIDPARTLRHE